MSDSDAIPTPFLLVEGAVAEANIARLMQTAQGNNLAVRPHIKTHKSRHLAAKQLAAGAIGLTVAKVGEAFAMEAVRPDHADDLLIAYPVVQPWVAHRLAELARRVITRGGQVRVAVDSWAAVDVIATAARSERVSIGLLIDVDTGNRRTGLASVEDVVRLACQIDGQDGVSLDGLMFFPGHIRGSESDQRPLLEAETEQIGAILDACRTRGLALPIVSGGTTPTQTTAHHNRHLTEIRPGTSVYNDANTVCGGYAALADCAATIVTTVVSTSVPGRVVVDAGSKTLTSDRCGPAPQSGYGIVVGHPDAVVTALYEEHGLIDWPGDTARPKVGNRLAIVPNHICPCVNLHDWFWWRDASGLQRWPVDARGRLS